MYYQPYQLDHSTVLISLSNGSGDWKYNSSLAYDEFYVENMKKLITKINTSNEFLEDGQSNGNF